MPFGPLSPIPRNAQISVAQLIDQLRDRLNLEIENCAGNEACENRMITEADLHRPGLALAGYIELFTYQRIQIIGNTECQYLHLLSAEDQKKAFANLIRFDIPVLFLTDGNQLPEYLLQMATEHHIPVFRTILPTTKFMFLLRDYLEDQFAIQSMVHASMVDVYGIGIMIIGKAGIGKSEVALDLIERGHRLVADDAIILTKKNNVILASATELNKHFMEIRGLGIIDIMSMFGIRAVRYQKRLEVIVELFHWDEQSDVDRTGLDKQYLDVLGVNIPHVKLPITPGKNITVIAEVIAMNHLLSHYGYDAAKAFQQKIKEQIARKTQLRAVSEIKRAIDYFEGDYE